MTQHPSTAPPRTKKSSPAPKKIGAGDSAEPGPKSPGSHKGYETVLQILYHALKVAEAALSLIHGLR